MNYPYMPSAPQPRFNPHNLIWIILAMLVFIVLFKGLATAETPPAILTASYYSIESLKKEGTYKYSKGRCADGSQFKDEAFTCATRLYPLGSFVKISYKGRFVICKVTDRIGKRFARTRIDLTPKAFGLLENLDRGLIPVKVERIK